jgi:hypothetical protein
MHVLMRADVQLPAAPARDARRETPGLAMPSTSTMQPRTSLPAKARLVACADVDKLALTPAGGEARENECVMHVRVSSPTRTEAAPGRLI